MTAFTSSLSGMRAQITAQIQGNGTPCNVLRFSPSTDGAGHKVGSYTSILLSGSRETMWIQPYSITRGGYAMTEMQGVAAETTHIAYQIHGGVSLIPKDRIAQSGDTFQFDMIDQQVYETHNELLLKQVRRQ